MSLVVIYSETAQKQLRAIDSVIVKRIQQKVQLYAKNRKNLANQVTRLRGSGLLRLRVGNYRVIFSEDGIVLTVAEIGHRREVYN